MLGSDWPTSTLATPARAAATTSAAADAIGRHDLRHHLLRLRRSSRTLQLPAHQVVRRLHPSLCPATTQAAAVAEVNCAMEVVRLDALWQARE